MQDIIAPNKEQKGVRRKPNKILLILGVITILLLIVAGTYFVTKNYFSKEEKSEAKTEEPVEEKPEEEGDFVYITSKAGLNLRAGDSTDEAIVYTLPFRAKVKLEDKNKDETWYKTTYENVSGWFSKEYTALTEPNDDTTDWENAAKDTPIYFSLKYPSKWKEKTSEKTSIFFLITQGVGGPEQIYLELLENTSAEVAKTLVDANHNIAGESVFAMAGIKGRKYVVQTIKDNKVIYTEDVILLEKDKKTIKIVGPADGEDSGDIFNLFVWTIKFDKETNNEEV